MSDWIPECSGYVPKGPTCEQCGERPEDHTAKQMEGSTQESEDDG